MDWFHLQYYLQCSCCYVPVPSRTSRVKDLLADDMKSEGATTFLGEVDDLRVDRPTHESRKKYVDTTVSLLDIAKPAKRKGKSSLLLITHVPRNLTIRCMAGPAKDFEIVPKVLDVIIWEDDFEDFVQLDEMDNFSTISFEEWEEIYNDCDRPAKKTYSAVLRGDKGG